MKPLQAEIALPLIARFLCYDPEISFARRTCKQWKEILYHHLHELSINFTKIQTATNQISFTLQAFPLYSLQFISIYHLFLQNIPSHFSVMKIFYRYLSNLRELRIKTITQLESAMIQDIDLYLEENQLMVPQLRKLTIEDCSCGLFYNSFWKGCALLQELHLISCSLVVDSTIQSIQEFLPNLVLLRVNKSFGLIRPVLLSTIHSISSEAAATSEDLQTMMKWRKLDLSRSPNLLALQFENGSICSTLKSLDLSFSKITSQYITTILTCCIQLEELVAKQCFGLQKECHIQSRSLKALDLSSCKNIEVLALDTPQLTTIALYYCLGLKECRFLSSVMLLTEVSFVLLKDLRTISWKAAEYNPNLAYINLCGCMKFGEIDELGSEKAEIERNIRENMFHFPFFTRLLSQEDQSRVEIVLIPVVNWLLMTLSVCPKFQWNQFFSHGIGSTIILANLNLLQSLVLKAQSKLLLTF